MKKRILIITHRPGRNYGGIAQAYALQKFLKNMGHEVQTTSSPGSPYVKYLAHNALLRRVLKKTPIQDASPISRHTEKFIHANIEEVPFDLAKKNSVAGTYDLYISGSDQVWRSAYSYVPDYLFSFLRSRSVPRISYAASFGKDNLDEYGFLLRMRTKRLAGHFDALSVREESGVELVRQHWGLDALHLVDPTLLLTADDYTSLVEKPSTKIGSSARKGIFTYILDPNQKTKSIVSKVEKSLSLPSFKIIEADRNLGGPLPPFEEWLKGFLDASFVITDSFHGTVFSLIFNKPFIAISNPHRGLARFASLLKMFSLEERLVSSPSEVSGRMLKSDCDWDKVNGLISRERGRSFAFLEKFL